VTDATFSLRKIAVPAFGPSFLFASSVARSRSPR
jgi:hypothetical protein